MEQAYATALETQEVKTHDDRWYEVELIEKFQQAQQTSKTNLFQFAQAHGVPESTLRHWIKRAENTEAPDAFVKFIESPTGLQVLHQITIAAAYVINMFIGGSIRPLCLFYELSGLWRVVASGYGTQQDVVKLMEETIIRFGNEERTTLSAQMAPKSITVTQDENFHEKPCLVAMEPVSNFILVEEYADDRKAETWNAAMERGLKGLPVQVFQSTSDEGTALIRHTETFLKAHHSPDLFHPQQDISRGTSLPLLRQEKVAKEKTDQAAEAVDQLEAEAKQYEEAELGPGRPRNFAPHIEAALQALDQAEFNWVMAKKRREDVRHAARAISRSYHPFALETGAVRDAKRVETDLETHFATIKRIIDEANLSAQCLAWVEKARRLVPQMVATIALVHTFIRKKIDDLGLDAKVEEAVMDYLIPCYYLKEVSRKASTAEARAKLRLKIEELNEKIENPTNVFTRLEPKELERINQIALECSQIFQRSSSNVEGRNGVLALRHHSLHHLSDRKLSALTVVHNFGITRHDGTTAAERFFGQGHRNLFEYLLMKMPLPKRPATRRSMAN